MNKQDVITLVKAKLAEDLEKQGSSLLELEECLITKQAEGIINDAIKSVINNAPELLLSGALLTGTTVGGLTYAANKHITDQDKALNDKRQEVNRYQHLTNRIKSDYDL